MAGKTTEIENFGTKSKKCTFSTILYQIEFIGKTIRTTIQNLLGFRAITKFNKNIHINSGNYT